MARFQLWITDEELKSGAAVKDAEKVYHSSHDSNMTNEEQKFRRAVRECFGPCTSMAWSPKWDWTFGRTSSCLCKGREYTQLERYRQEFRLLRGQERSSKENESYKDNGISFDTRRAALMVLTLEAGRCLAYGAPLSLGLRHGTQHSRFLQAKPRTIDTVCTPLFLIACR